VSETNPLWDEPEPPGPEMGTPGGDGEDTDQQPPEEPQRSYLDIDSSGDSYVRVKVDGEELEVPLREALSGYSRTADYTRKTQELAQQRQGVDYALAVQRALQAQPEETIRLLARQYGVSVAEATAMAGQQPSASPYEDDDIGPYADPMERRLAQIERQNAQLSQQWQQRQADDQLRTAIGNLQQRYQLTDSDTREVVSTALQAGMGPAAFDMVWKNIAYDRAQQARAAHAAQQEAAQQQRRQAGANAAALVGNGPSATRAGTSPAPESSGPMTIAQAFDAALREQGTAI